MSRPPPPTETDPAPLSALDPAQAGPEAADRRTSFYGRRVGKPLRAGQADALGRLLPQRGVSLEEVARPETLFATQKRDLYLEIGFGGGEHLVAEAARAPEIGFIGCEPFVNGMASALLGLESAKLTNVRVYHEDAALLLDRLPDGALGRAELLYPDPWPKRRHWKRRFVRAENLDRLARTLRKGAPFRFASDVPDYVDWTLRELSAHPAFRWTAERADDWRRPYDGWPGTRYEAKALKEGRVPTYLTFERV